ncbi:5'-methylthioadenosine/adenosylhomocysteine nucleosidase [Atopobium sp. oral taxon 199]|uniref:5'-methylthioadenosine/adenosylhomocysteine nucleosidase n=1 Tax=Atopobium sp. oral taxon 199 TaxID=712156 RepID=UPI00034E2D40|nr:5'-methylthioadenosine/adenosylhomocysteine nucleosidase [Atopobium sp. oral taxon 199]EPD77734.1 MTA/SAH nucleosidase [Atopobium sp. oral taxon 199 str. F0494]
MKVGIIGAMEEEVALLKQEMTSERVVQIAGRTFHEGSIAQTPVVVVQSGIGKVNAAFCTQILIDRFGVDCIINTGIAGLLGDDLIVGSVVISTDCMQHDVDLRALGYPQGQIPGVETVSFSADKELRRQAVCAAQETAFGVKTVEGRIVSGDQFVADVAEADALKDFGAVCCEMEGAAIAQVAWLNNVPFVIVRLMSDKPGVSSELDYAAFEKTASRRCAKIVLRMVERLSQAPSSFSPSDNFGQR